MASKIQVRRATAAAWGTANPTLSVGEVGFDTTTNRFKIGDGTTVWNALDYYRARAAVSDSAPLAITGDLWMDTTGDTTILKVYNGAGWDTVGGGSSGADFLVVQVFS